MPKSVKKPTTTTDVHGYQESIDQESMGNRNTNERTNNTPGTKPQEAEKSHQDRLKGPLSNEGERSGTNKSQ